MNRKCLVLTGLFFVILMVVQVACAATVAHWDFSDAGAADGAFIPGNGDRYDFDGDGAMDSDDFRIGAIDQSGNGNHLTAWSSSWMKWSEDSIQGDFSMKTHNDWPCAGTDSTFNPHITGIDVEAITPAQWTVECLFKSSDLSGTRTMVGRDGKIISGNDAVFYFSTRETDLAIDYRDVGGTRHNLQVAAGLKTNTWYNVAAVSDGTILKLYLNGKVIGSLNLADTSTDTSLGRGFGIWSVARGMWEGEHADRFFGVIDEVAISDESLVPGSFVIHYRPDGVGGSKAGRGDLVDNSPNPVSSKRAGINVNWTPEKMLGKGWKNEKDKSSGEVDSILCTVKAGDKPETRACIQYLKGVDANRIVEVSLDVSCIGVTKTPNSKACLAVLCMDAEGSMLKEYRSGISMPKSTSHQIKIDDAVILPGTKQVYVMLVVEVYQKATDNDWWRFENVKIKIH